MNQKFQDVFLRERIFETQQFRNWIEQIFEIKLKLEIVHDEIYQDTFYIKIFELITYGKKYLEDVNNKIEEIGNLNINNNLYYTNKLILKTID